MNNDIIYALVENLEWDCLNYFFIKIKESDRCKFINFAKDTRVFGWSEGITIKAWAKEIYLEADKHFNAMTVLTINEYKESLKEDLKRIEEMGDRHYLKDKKEYFIKLLNYEFQNVETIY